MDSIKTISGVALRDHVDRLTAGGPRHQDNPAAVRATLEYLTDHLVGYGYRVERESYGDAPHQVNLLAMRDNPTTAPVLEVGAHWDSTNDGPGADDNASGVAGLLEIARVFAEEAPTALEPKRTEPRRAVRFCLYGEEEDESVGYLGSRAHVARLDADGAGRTGAVVEGVIVLEMIAYRDTRSGSQRFPEDIAAMMGEPGEFGRGDFIAVVGDPGASEYLAAIQAAARGQDSSLPVLPLSVPAGDFVNVGRSDHYPYWLSGRNGVMVTDTAEFRNPNYHRSTDTIDTLDFVFAESVTRTVAAAVGGLVSVVSCADRPAEG